MTSSWSLILQLSQWCTVQYIKISFPVVSFRTFTDVLLNDSRLDYDKLQDENFITTFRWTRCFSVQTWLLELRVAAEMYWRRNYVDYTQISQGLWLSFWVPHCKSLIPGTSVQVVYLLLIPWSWLTAILVNFVYCRPTSSSQSLEQPSESILPKMQLDLARSSETQEQAFNRTCCKKPKDTRSKFVRLHHIAKART